MAEYKSTFGTKVQNYTTNPDNPIEGQVWYNETDNVLKYQIPNLLASWRTGNNLNTARTYLQSSGTQASSIAFGGGTGLPGPVTANTESYNGTSWTEVNDLNSGKQQHASTANTSTSALAFAGSPGPTATNESWNGTSWTEVGDLNTARRLLGGSGADSTSALAFGGFVDGGPASQALTESWNGSAWTEVADLNTARYGLGGIGTQTAALGVGGNPGRAITESWNGSAWTEVNDLNTAREALNGGGAGTQTSGLIFGGVPTGPTLRANTEEWDGSSWTEVADLSTANSSKRT